MVFYLVGCLVLVLGHCGNALPTVERNKFDTDEIAKIENAAAVIENAAAVTGKSLVLEQNFTDIFQYILAANKRFSESAVARIAGVTMYQGDIIANDDTDVVESNTTEVSGSRQKRAIIRDINRRWRKSGSKVIIPYVITSSNAHAKSKIEGATREWMRKVPCLHFKRKYKERDYLSFFSGGGCYSMVGRQGGKQVVSIGRGCEHHGVIVHEIGHALGFWHEQSRPDRDKFVTINWSNIPENVKSNFKRYDKSRVRNYWSSYDYYSIMHYGPKAFAKNPNVPTIIPKGDFKIGQRKGLSTKDAWQANKMYCPSTPGPKPTPRPPTTCRDKDSDCPGWAKNRYCTNAKYKKWMAENCCKSCRNPPTAPPPCVDKDSDCPGWAKDRYCTNAKYKTWMAKNCCKSCRSVPSCSDKNANCRDWARNGYCRHPTYKVFMARDCCASCR